MGSLLKALIVDDEKHIRTLIKAILRSLDCEIIGEAENGQEAIDLYKEHKPDIVMLDINMPVMEGDEALQAIIAYDPEAVVIMLTSLADIETVQTCIELGATNYIRKDTPIQELKGLIQEACQKIR